MNSHDYCEHLMSLQDVKQMWHHLLQQVCCQYLQPDAEDKASQDCSESIKNIQIPEARAGKATHGRSKMMTSVFSWPEALDCHMSMGVCKCNQMPLVTSIRVAVLTKNKDAQAHLP